MKKKNFFHILMSWRAGYFFETRKNTRKLARLTILK